MLFFFFKQKTAYEMRISDWSSDVCSSDLRSEETRHLAVPAHQTSAPPPKEKKDRKKLEAAKAIDKPKTICTSRRKPPDVSPNARLSPVTMMMITATILATDRKSTRLNSSH